MIQNQIHYINRNNLILLTIFLWLLGCSRISAQKTITVNNLDPRTDTEGNIVDAHDGRVIQFGDRYYWYGTAYGNTNGFVSTNHYRCYSSDDLNTWIYEGRLLPGQPEGVYYRPHVIHNASTGKYVLWYNWYPELWNGQFGVAISDAPHGPFEIVNDNVQMANSEYGLGDFGLFVDKDGSGYISYNTIRDHMVSIERLSPDYLSSTMENGGVIAKHVEAGSQFRRDGKYYLLTDNTCCFCNYGSGARVYISDNPLSGYVLTGNINRYPGRPANVLHDQELVGTRYEILERKPGGFQSIEVTLEKSGEIAGIGIHLFTGNRQGQCGEVSNPRVHPRIVTPAFRIEKWQYNAWMDVPLESLQVSHSALSEQVMLTVRTDGRHFRITPDSSSTPFEKVYVNEISIMDQNGERVNIIEGFITGEDIRRTPIMPAQQKYVMELPTAQGTKYIWMGDLWGSASDNIKGHDYQYWSAPLQFNQDGTIRRMSWTHEWTFKKR